MIKIQRLIIEHLKYLAKPLFECLAYLVILYLVGLGAIHYIPFKLFDHKNEILCSIVNGSFLIGITIVAISFLALAVYIVAVPIWYLKGVFKFTLRQNL